MISEMKGNGGRRIYWPFSFQATTFCIVEFYSSVWVYGNQLSVKVKIAELQQGFWKPTQTGSTSNVPLPLVTYLPVTAEGR